MTHDPQDPFTTAARAEANRITEHWEDERNRRRFLSMFTSGAEWARAHLAAQEASDEMIDAAVDGRKERGWFTSAHPEDNRDEMRSIISDALAARRAREEER